jgi:ankyrin repeat protein
MDVVKFLIEKGNADINATDKKGDTCLAYASN